MKRKTSHTVILSVLIAAMSLTSSGFTAVVGYCSMSQSATCCCGDAHKSASSTKALAFANAGFSCYSEHLVGGLSDITAVSSSPASSKFDAAAVQGEALEHRYADIPVNPLTSSHLLSRAETPAKLDIFLEVRSLLI